MTSKEPDLLIVSDGSGHVDGYGGWAVTVFTPDRNIQVVRLGMINGITVDRAEMTAMLAGLAAALDILEKWPDRPERPWVHVKSDRENMVLSMKGVYGRRNSPDLWASYEWFEKQLDITCEHIDREADCPELQQMDLHASTGRIVAKTYAEIQQPGPNQYDPTRPALAG
jgi:ribonuclease HI